MVSLADRVGRVRQAQEPLSAGDVLHRDLGWLAAVATAGGFRVPAEVQVVPNSGRGTGASFDALAAVSPWAGAVGRPGWVGHLGRQSAGRLLATIQEIAEREERELEGPEVLAPFGAVT